MLCHILYNKNIRQMWQLCAISLSIHIAHYVVSYFTQCFIVSIFISAWILHNMLYDIYLSKNIAHYAVRYLSQQEYCTLLYGIFFSAWELHTMLCHILFGKIILHFAVWYISQHEYYTRVCYILFVKNIAHNITKSREWR